MTVLLYRIFGKTGLYAVIILNIMISNMIGPKLTFVFGSLLAYLISQTHDVWMFHYLRKKTKGKHLWLRNNLSTITSQAIDTVIYSVVVWWAIFDFKTAVELALVKYVFKIFIALVDTPFLYWARTWDVSERDWSDPAEPET